jgi:thiosulfate/3-mercaptopyruvate sulfurtransferase
MLIESLLVIASCCAGVSGRLVIPLPTPEPVIVTAPWLAAHLADRNTIVLVVVHSENDFRTGHIPGARPVAYQDITTSRDGLWTELPDPKRLRDVFESAGVTDDSRVVIYSDDPLMASRAFFSLEYLGQRHAAVLDGGLKSWSARGGRVATDSPLITVGRITTRERTEVVADASWIRGHLRSPHIALVDTRSDVEYLGTGERHGMPSRGHIPGARQLQWQELFADPGAGVFRPPAELASIFAGRAPRGDTVVTYCYVGYRASMTYLVARALGYEAKLYDGSYQDWARQSLPTTPGDRP